MMVALADGRRVRVKQLLGEGAQGWVYLVDCPEKARDKNCAHSDKALKWYKKCPNPAFIDNLAKNVAEGAPSSQFIWPEAVCRRQLGSTGYLMALRPEGYHELSDFRMAKVRFQSFAAILRASIETCQAFKQLHLKGLCYQDLNDGGFFIHPKTGEVLICDNDNVFPHGQNSGVMGKARYMAPEVVTGRNLPDTYSDRFSLAVILFMYAFIDHPFEGENVLQYPCMTEELERRLFGDEMCFVYDDSRRNAPVKGIHRNILLFWNMWPETMKNLFKEEFAAEKLHNPQQRRTELEWISSLMQIRDQLVSCPYCGDETFVGRESTGFFDRLYNHADRCLNPHCKKPIAAQYGLTKASRCIPLIPGSLLYFHPTIQPTAQVHIHIKDPNLLLLRNMEASPWTVTTPMGKVIQIARGEYVPVKPGLKIQSLDQIFEISKL